MVPGPPSSRRRLFILGLRWAITWRAMWGWLRDKLWICAATCFSAAIGAVQVREYAVAGLLLIAAGLSLLGYAVAWTGVKAHPNASKIFKVFLGICGLFILGFSPLWVHKEKGEDPWSVFLKSEPEAPKTSSSARSEEPTAPATALPPPDGTGRGTKSSKTRPLAPPSSSFGPAPAPKVPSGVPSVASASGVVDIAETKVRRARWNESRLQYFVTQREPDAMKIDLRATSAITPPVRVRITFNGETMDADVTPKLQNLQTVVNQDSIEISFEGKLETNTTISITVRGKEPFSPISASWWGVE